MSLRARLLAAIGLVALVALVVADVVTYRALESFLLGRVDQQLASIPFPRPYPDAGPPLSGQPAPGEEGQATPNEGPSLSRQAGANFFELRRPNGHVAVRRAAVEPGGAEYSPELPTRIGLRTPPPGEVTVKYFDAPATKTNGPEFRVRVTEVHDGSQLVAAAPLDATASTLHHLLWIEVAVTGAALVAAATLGWWLVRVGLRPLGEMEETAEAIAGGALDRRVPGENGRTEVGRLARVLNVMLSRIQQAFAQRDATERQLRQSEERMRRFVADASHELRTPLAAVSAYAELFGRGAGGKPEDLERVMRGIRLESERMRILVEDLLLLARLDEGRPLERQPVELVGIAADAVQAAQAVGPAWPLRFEAAQPVEVLGDPQRLRQVIDNLLANVRAHTPAGTVATLRVARRDDHVLLQVEDDGPGLTADQAEHVFERFYRADTSRSRHHGGAGLGLSLVAAIVASHGGQVSAGGEPGRGSTFTVRLPLPSGPLPAAEPDEDLNTDSQQPHRSASRWSETPPAGSIHAAERSPHQQARSLGPPPP